MSDQFMEDYKRDTLTGLYCQVDEARKAFEIACKSPDTDRAEYDAARDRYVDTMRLYHSALGHGA